MIKMLPNLGIKDFNGYKCKLGGIPGSKTNWGIIRGYKLKVVLNTIIRGEYN